MTAVLSQLTTLEVVALAVLGTFVAAIGHFDRTGDNKVFYRLLLGLIGVLAIAFVM